MKKHIKTLDFWFFVVVGTFVLLPILAPILSTIGLHGPAKIIYFIYSFTCHQFHSRSIHIFDSQFAWCARDTGIWIGFFLGAILYKLGFVKAIKIYFILIFMIPIGLDGGIQSIFTFLNLGADGSLATDIGYVSNNLTRFMTGSFFGLGLSLALVPQILHQNLEIKSEVKTKLKTFFQKSHIKYQNFSFIHSSIVKLFIVVILFFTIYFSFVHFWDLTSSKYQPTNELDSIPKIQENNFFERRRNGECPTQGDTIKELFALDCFF